MCGTLYCASLLWLVLISFLPALADGIIIAIPGRRSPVCPCARSPSSTTTSRWQFQMAWPPRGWTRHSVAFSVSGQASHPDFRKIPQSARPRPHRDDSKPDGGAFPQHLRQKNTSTTFVCLFTFLEVASAGLWYRGSGKRHTPCTPRFRALSLLRQKVET